VYCRRGIFLYFVCAGPLWPGVGLASLVTILLGVCGVSRCVSRSPGLVFSHSKNNSPRYYRKYIHWPSCKVPIMLVRV
jgi:hypothetical protein